MHYPVTPRPYHRMTQKSRFTEAAQRYYAWKEELQIRGFNIPDDGAVLVFHMPMPKSWSKRKKADMCGAGHQQRPDLDNLIKAACDAARYATGGDHTIWNIQAWKVWSENGAIEVR